MLVADLIVHRLRDWGVHRVFGYTGDGIDPVMGALRRAGGDPELVTARHEEMAAFMATGHAKYTGGLGVCLSTQGPGAVHMLNGLYDAKLDGQPVLALVGQQATSVLGSEYQQEIDLQRLAGDACAQFVQSVMSPEQLPMVLDRAIRVALATRSPTCLVLPVDVQREERPDELPQEHGVMVSSPGLPRPLVVPQDADLERAAAVLHAGERVALLVGQGAAGAAEEVYAIADRLGAGIATSLLGKPVLDERRPEVTGVMGHLGTTAAQELLQGCDTLLLVGTNDPWTEFYPPPGQARAVQIDLDGRNLAVRYPVEVPLVGDARLTLRALLEQLDERTGGGAWRQEVEDGTARWHALAAAKAEQLEGAPLSPQRVVRELSHRLPADAQVSVDVGSITYWYARHLRLPPGVPAHLSSTLASMGSAMPYGIAAKLAAPERPVVALAGDGAMQMNGLAELITVADRWRGWADPRFVVLVLHNDELAEVTWEQRETEGDPRFETSQRLPSFPYAEYAKLLGLGGVRVTAPQEVGPAWDAALSADRPTLIEAVVDPATVLLAPLQTSAQVADMYAALRLEDGTQAERALAHLRRERALEGFSDDEAE
jgi:pyruvate dehydrogenase (quinone)